MNKKENLIQLFEYTYSDIDWIGKLNYFLTVFFGKNKAVRILCIEDESKANTNDFPQQLFNKNELIVTISKKFLIITRLVGNRQTPIIVKKWNQLPKIKNPADFMHDGTEYIDSSGNNWLHLKTVRLESLRLETKLGEDVVFILK